MFAKSRAYLEQAIKEGQASGIAFLLRRPGKEDLSWYLGSHAKEGQGAINRPVEADSLFDLASVSKIFATVCLIFSAESEG
jgi:CubicO group peptidase (beta-lactamase class C family)